MIRHTVVFTLHHPDGSQLERAFLRAAQELGGIPSVKNFECLRQVSAKNDFAFGLSMEFDSAADYDAYNTHPLHVEFVNNRWIPEVAEFMEIDYELYAED